MRYHLPIAAAALALASCSDQTEPLDSKVLAEVNGAKITADTFRYWWQKETPGEDSAETRRVLLDKLISRKTSVQKAQAAGLDKDPQVVEAIESLLIARLQETELQPQIKAAGVTEPELRAAYENTKHTRFARPARTRVAALWFDTRGQRPLALRYQPRLEKVRDTLLAAPASIPTDQGFGQLSNTNSEHRPTRFKGGDFGWIEIGKTSGDPLEEVVSEIAQQLPGPGSLSEVVTRQEGIFLVRLIERQNANTRTFAEVRQQLEREWLAAKHAAIRADFDTALSVNATVQQHLDNLDALTGLPVRTSPPTQLSLNHLPEPTNDR